MLVQGLGERAHPGRANGKGEISPLQISDGAERRKRVTGRQRKGLVLLESKGTWDE